MSTGFAIWSFMPDASASATFSAKASAVMAMMGIVPACGWDEPRIARVASCPFITGICTSISMAAYVPSADASNLSTASRPFHAPSTVRPAVNIDYVGSVDGVEFSGGNTGGAGTDVTLGVTVYIDDFLEQLIGHRPGETFDVEVTFPDPYTNNPDLSGKDAVFVTTVNYISGDAITPEWNDAFVQQNLQPYYGFSTTAEIEALIASSIIGEREGGYVKSWLVDNSTFKTLPQQLVRYEERSLIDYFETSAANYNMDLETFLTNAAGVATTQELIEANRETIDGNVKFYLVAQAIAEAEGMTVSEQDIANYFLLSMGATDYSGYIEHYGEPYVKWFVLQNKVVTDMTAAAARA